MRGSGALGYLVRCTWLRKHTAGFAGHLQGAPPLLVIRLARADRMRAPADAHISPPQHALLLVQVLASVSAHTAAFRRRSCARSRSWVQCRCSALAGGLSWARRCCCCCDRVATLKSAAARRRSATSSACIFIRTAGRRPGNERKAEKLRHCCFLLATLHSKSTLRRLPRQPASDAAAPSGRAP